MQLRGRNVGSGRLVNRPGSSFSATLAFIKRIVARVCRSAVGHNFSSSTRLSEEFIASLYESCWQIDILHVLRKIKKLSNEEIFPTRKQRESHKTIGAFAQSVYVLHARRACISAAGGFISATEYREV